MAVWSICSPSVIIASDNYLTTEDLKVKLPKVADHGVRVERGPTSSRNGEEWESNSFLLVTKAKI